MGSANSQLIVHEQPFVIRTRVHISKNGAKSPSINEDVRRELDTYLNGFMFQNQIESDLDSYFQKKQDRVLQIMVRSVTYSSAWRTVTVRGLIRVIKPTHLSKDFSVGAVRKALQVLIPLASKSRPYPVRNFGQHLGSGPDRLSLRFYKMTTAAKIVVKK